MVDPLSGQDRPAASRRRGWHVLVWVLTAVVAAGWSLLCWVVLQLLTGPDWRALGDGAWMDWLAQWRFPAWLADWLPLGEIGQLQTWFAALGPWVASVLAQAPSMLGWLTPLLWAGWALGMLVLLMLGVAGSVLVVALLRSAEASVVGRSS